MRLGRLVYLLAALLFCALVLADSAAQVPLDVDDAEGQPADEAPPSDYTDDYVDHQDGGQVLDGKFLSCQGSTLTLDTVCAPLVEAREILQALQPRLNAHLPKSLGGFAPSQSLGDQLGWGHDVGVSSWALTPADGTQGPLSNAVRLLPRVISALNPLNLVSKIPAPEWKTRVSRATKERADRMLELLDEAKAAGCNDALALHAEVLMFPPKGVNQDLTTAFTMYLQFLTRSSDPHAQFMVGFFYASGLGGAARDQGKATLYYTFAALQGYKPAQMALGYRYWAGIGVKEDCHTALDFYESAAKNAYDAFRGGPPGGMTLLLTRTRLSDRFGGIFGPRASWASTGANAARPAVQAIMAAAAGESEAEVLEYYQYHSERDSPKATNRLGRFFYLGSIHTHGHTLSAGAEAVGEIPQSFEKARKYFFYVARKLWPSEFDANGNVVPRRKMSKQDEEKIASYARVAASYIGRMALRGEGMPQDFRRARLWFERAADYGDPEAYNGLGIIYRDGLGVPPNRDRALKYFESAASAELHEAQVNIGRVLIEGGKPLQAVPFLEAALRNGSPFEAFHLLASIHATGARLPGAAGDAGACGVSVGYYKLVSELGAWDDDYLGEADRAWARGEEDKAMLGWWIAAEMGYEAGQNNVAFLLDRGLTLGSMPEDTVLALWTRSAAQGNADAMVMVGDYYYRGDAPVPDVNETEGSGYPLALQYYQTAADKQSSMAYWNLGYMYENGQGVPQSWHLAKRHYDLSLEHSADAYLPWLLSLTKLYLRR